MSIMKFKNLFPFGVEIGTSGNDLNSELALSVKNILREKSLVLIRDVSFENDENMLHFAEKLSYKNGDRVDKILHWNFGPIMEMRFDPNSENYLFSQEKVPFHWDGAFHQEPAYLLFHCLESNGKGGETLFTQTEDIFHVFNLEEREYCKDIRLNFSTEKKAHYGGSINVPLLQHHPLSNKNILRFAEEVKTHLNPVKLVVSAQDIEKSNKIYAKILHHVYLQEFCYSHTWKKNDLLIVDNFSCIHGRNPLLENMERKFKRVQIL